MIAITLDGVTLERSGPQDGWEVIARQDRPVVTTGGADRVFGHSEIVSGD
ncbi:hypothetical protein ACFWJ5_02970 [Streptomyces qaidamensis]